jgi:II/X family phage/plasmid replication protein
MIDWLTALVRWPHSKPINSGNVLSLAPTGEMEWSVDKNLTVVGSHDSKIQVKTVHVDHPCSHLLLSGNPVKWFQGHNVWGTSDLPGLLAETITAVIRKAAPDEDPYSFLPFLPLAELKRTDLTRMYRLSSEADVYAWLRGAAESASISHRGRGQFAGDTLYWGKSSRRWSLKAYAKGPELRKHKLKGWDPSDLKSVTDFAQAALRVELVLRSLQLKDLGLSEVQSWKENTAETVYDSYLSKLSFSENMRFVSPDFDYPDLPARLLAPVQLWHEGHDLRAMYPRATWYRYRRDIMKAVNLDISLPPPKQRPDRANVVPLIKVLEAKPMEVPEWASGTPLYFEPAVRPGLRLVS